MDNARGTKDIAGCRRLLGWYLLLTALLLTPGLFFGFELCDSGFYATFYDQIFRRPESVSYNFMYYLSGVAGGIVSELSGGSLLALRIAGLLACVAASYFASTMSRGKEGWFGLFAGIIVICIGAWQSPLSLYNDNMTAAMACGSLALLAASFRAKDQKKRLWLALGAGAVAGLNTWTRIPNVLEYFFVLLIPLSGFHGKECWKSIGIWSAGWLAGLVSGIGIAALLGHMGSLLAALEDLLATGAASSTDSTHSIGALVGAQIDAWLRIIKLMIKVSATGGIAWYVSRYTKTKWIKAGAWVILGVPCLAWLAEADIVTSLAAISLFGCLGQISIRSERWARTMAWAGILMMAILPLGSDGGIYNAGTVTFWIAAPPGFDFLRKECGRIATWCICATLALAGAVATFQGSFYFDSTPIGQMQGSPNSAQTAGILTSVERAKRINKILNGVSAHIEEGDTLMVYGSAPMINHLTGTVPAMGCSWPELLTPAMLREKLANTKAPRNIMLLRFKTIGGDWGTPLDSFMHGLDKDTNRFHNAKKSEVILDYISTQGYREIARDSDYILYRHPGR